jgi:predicted permease
MFPWRWYYKVRLRLRTLFDRKQVERELDEEFGFHLQQRMEHEIAGGTPPAEAHRVAVQAMEGIEQKKEECRDMRHAQRIEHFLQDVRYSCRSLWKSPGFTAVAVLSLALGIGANAAIFELLDAIRLSGLPVKNPSQLVTLTPAKSKEFFRAGFYASREEAFSYAQMDELRKHQQAFSGILTFWPSQFNLSTSGRSRYAETLLVSGNFLDVLGIAPLLGSGLRVEDDKLACVSTPAVLSYGFWQKEFGGEIDALSKTVSLNGHRFPVGGVMPPSFFGFEPGQRFDVLLPLCASNVFASDGKGYAFDRSDYWLTPIARLKPGWSVERASRHITQLSPAIFRDTVPAEYRPGMAEAYLKNRLKAESASSGVSALRSQYTDPLWILMAITISVLVIVCANLANLLLARASGREREIAVRQALGASRPRLISQLLTESLLLSVAGLAIGIFLAQVTAKALVAFLNGDTGSIAIPAGLNWHLFGFLAAIAVLTCILFGLAPAIRASARKPVSAMYGARSSTGTRERNRFRRILVTTQVALSLVLMAAALLFSGSLRNLLSTNVGFDSRNILVVNVAADNPEFENEQKRAAVFRQLDEQIRSIGEVSSAARIAFAPFSGFSWGQPVHAEGDNSATGGKAPYFNRAGPGYFATMGTKLLAGREFTDHDDLSAPKVAVVNQTFAKNYFPQKNPVGHTIRLEGQQGKPDDIYEVVGLVAETKYNDLREPEPDTVFLSMGQEDRLRGGATIVIRGHGSIESLMSAVQSEALRVNPHLLLEFRVLSTQIERSVLRESLMANLSVAFGILAACLSTLGLYGVMSYVIARRRNEVGIRLALGATRGSVYRLIALDAGAMLLAGLAIGAAAYLYLAHYAESLLFGLKPTDPLTLVLASGVLVATGIIATLTPAIRAARLDPMTALRSE